MTEAVEIRILLVDDHPLVRDGLRARLEAAPRLRVVGEAGSSQEAIEQAGACRPDRARLAGVIDVTPLVVLHARRGAAPLLYREPASLDCWHATKRSFLSRAS